MERLVIMSDEAITDRDLPPYLGGLKPPSRGSADSTSTGVNVAEYGDRTLREFREEIESEFIRYKLGEFGWNISRTAQALGIERTNLHKKLRALGIRRESQ